MYGFVIVLHVIVCALLVTIILMQSGRGGGLTENFSQAESLFGAKTNTVLVKATSVMAVFFLATCLSLAFLSSQKSKSLINDQTLTQTAPVGQPIGQQIPGNQVIPQKSPQVDSQKPSADQAQPEVKTSATSETSEKTK